MPDRFRARSGYWFPPERRSTITARLRKSVARVDGRSRPLAVLEPVEEGCPPAQSNGVSSRPRRARCQPPPPASSHGGLSPPPEPRTIPNLRTAPTLPSTFAPGASRPPSPFHAIPAGLALPPSCPFARRAGPVDGFQTGRISGIQKWHGHSRPSVAATESTQADRAAHSSRQTGFIRSGWMAGPKDSGSWCRWSRVSASPQELLLRSR